MDTPKTLMAAVRYFADRRVCSEYLKGIKWPDGNITCPTCGCDSVHELSTRPGLMKCNRRACQKQFSLKRGTIMEDSPLGLDVWFTAIWAIANCKNGISSHELARACGITQKSAWFVLHRIRKAMETDEFQKLEGTIEVDETYIGGEAANMHKDRREQAVTGRGGVDKDIVQGILQRDGPVRTFHVDDTTGLTLRGNVKQNVERGATVYTDAHASYTALSDTYQHASIDHAREYVREACHINGMENFWSLLKRGLKGTYIHVASFHLFRYCAEQCFRFNHRKLTDGGRFHKLMGRLAGKLSWRMLTGEGGAGFMGIT